MLAYFFNSGIFILAISSWNAASLPLSFFSHDGPPVDICKTVLHCPFNLFLVFFFPFFKCWFQGKFVGAIFIIPLIFFLTWQSLDLSQEFPRFLIFYLMIQNSKDAKWYTVLTHFCLVAITSPLSLHPWYHFLLFSFKDMICCFCFLVIKLCLTLWTAGFPVLHYLPECAQSEVH